MTRRPSFQFYPADWRKDAELQSCSMTARGLWHEMLCIMHECEPYGELRVNGNPMSTGQLARLVGMSMAECKRTLAELETAGVPSKTDDGAYFSRRMKRDEELRNARAVGGEAGAEHGIKGAEHGAKGGRPRKETGDKKPPLNPPPSSSTSSSASTDTSSLRSDVSAEPQAARAPEPLGLPVITLPTNREGREVGIFPAQVDEFNKLYPNVDVHQQLRAMRGWLLNNRENRKTARGMPRFVNRWLSKEQDKHNGQGNRGQIDRQARQRTPGSASFFDACVDSIRGSNSADSEREPDQTPPRGTVTVLPPPRHDGEAGGVETGAVRGRLATSKGFR